MRKAVSSVMLVTWIFMWSGAVFAAPKEATTPVQAKEVVEGVYTIFQMDREIGFEAFSRTVYNNNTVVLESKTIKTTAMPDSSIETSFMTVEDDSYFLIDYASTKSAGNLRQDNEIEMYANVAIITTVTNEKRNVQTRVLPTGALCIQHGIAHQLELYLGRYNDDVGGKQSILVFDPVAKWEHTKIMEMMGQEETAVNGDTILCTVYTLRGQRGIEMKLFVDESRRIVKAENPMQRMIFVLSRMQEE